MITLWSHYKQPVAAFSFRYFRRATSNWGVWSIHWSGGGGLYGMSVLNDQHVWKSTIYSK